MKVWMRLRAAGCQGLGGTVDVAVGGARQAADHASPDELGDLVDRLEVAVRRDREAGLDHVDAHGLEDLGDAELLVRRSSSSPGDCSPSRKVVSKMMTRSG